MNTLRGDVPAARPLYFPLPVVENCDLEGFDHDIETMLISAGFFPRQFYGCYLVNSKGNRLWPCSGQGGGGGIFSRNILSVHVEAVIYILVWLNNSLLENRKRMNMKVSI